MANNYLTSNRATLQLSGLPETEIDVTYFKLPEISVGQIEVPTRFNPGKEADNRVSFGSLEIEFLIDEDLKNWRELFEWITSLGMPTGHWQYRGDENRFMDGSLIIYSSHNNPIAKIKFYELFPMSLSGIDFSEADSDTVVRKATASFSLLAYEFE